MLTDACRFYLGDCPSVLVEISHFSAHANLLFQGRTKIATGKTLVITQYKNVTEVKLEEGTRGGDIPLII